jgi:hypothetical protein
MAGPELVGTGRIERPTSSISGRRSHQLSYMPLAESGGPDPHALSGHVIVSSETRRACPVHSPHVASAGFEPALPGF